MSLIEKRMIAVHIKPAEELRAFDPVMLEDIGGRMRIRKADPAIEHPHAILNSDHKIDADGMIVVPSWWYKALVSRFNAEHNHA